MQSRPLKKEDISQAASLDKSWFGEYATTEEDLEKYIEKYPQDSIAILHGNKLEGFATFEICNENMPNNYIGKISYNGKAMFLSSFTTVTNYNKKDFSADVVLLQAAEQKAKELGCHELWEGLSIDHPYNTENNPKFDAFRSYITHGFTVDKENPLAWEPNKDLSIPCYLFRKVI